MVFLAGLLYCIIIRLINICTLVSNTPNELNYYYSMPFGGINNYWRIEIIFSGFCLLGLILLINCKGRIFSAALILSCLSIGINTTLLKAPLKNLHEEYIFSSVELAFKWGDYGPRLWEIHNRAINQWNTLYENKYEPVAGVYAENVD